MPYTPIPDAWTDAGQPTKEELFKYLVDNQVSFDADIESLKQTSTIGVFNLRLSGDFASRTEAELTAQLPVFRAPAPGSIVELRTTLLEASTSGTLSVMIDKSIDNGVNWAPILTGAIELTGTTSGSQSGTVNFTSEADQAFAQNDMLRVRILTAQTDQGAFQLSCYAEVV